MRGASLKVGSPVRLAVASLGCAALFMSTGCGGEDHASSGNAGEMASPSPTSVGLRGEIQRTPVHWRVAAVVGPNAIRIFSRSGFCDGYQVSRYGAIHISERIGSVQIRPIAVEHLPKRGVCRGVGQTLEHVVHLQQPFTQVKVFDATTPTPGLRWPRSR